MAMKPAPALLVALENNRADLDAFIAEGPDWSLAAAAFDAFFKSLADPADPLWPAARFDLFKKAYEAGKEGDKGMSNITLRTLDRLPEAERNAAKKMFLWRLGVGFRRLLLLNH